LKKGGGGKQKVKGEEGEFGGQVLKGGERDKFTSKPIPRTGVSEFRRVEPLKNVREQSSLP